MKGCQYRYEVERFVARDVEARRQLELDGWVISDAAVTAVRLVSAGNSRTVAANPQADDADRRLLLSLRETIGDEAADLRDACLEIEIANGDTIALDIGHLYRPPGWMPAVIDLQEARNWAGVTISAPDAAALADAVIDDFAALDHDIDLFVHSSGTRLLATSHRYGLRFSTVTDGELNPTAREAARDGARLAARSLRDRLRQPVPMLVHRATAVDNDDTAHALGAALRARNPDAVMLWLDDGPASGDIIRYRADGSGTPDPSLLLASARDPWDLMLVRARDRLISPR